MLKLSHHEISNSGSLSPLLTLHSDPHVRRSYHVYVIGSVSYRHRQKRRTVLHVPNDILFLGRSAPIADSLVERQVGRNGLGSIQQVDFVLVDLLKP